MIIRFRVKIPKGNELSDMGSIRVKVEEKCFKEIKVRQREGTIIHDYLKWEETLGKKCFSQIGRSFISGP